MLQVLESPTATTHPVIGLHVDKSDGQSGAESSSSPNQKGGLFGWIPGKGILAKVAEKARSSVDTMITTLDPQMKEFICEQNLSSLLFIYGLCVDLIINIIY